VSIVAADGELQGLMHSRKEELDGITKGAEMLNGVPHRFAHAVNVGDVNDGC